MIRNWLIVTTTVITAVGLAACAMSEGVKPDDNIGASFVKGVSTESDWETKLGKPMKVESDPNGATIVTFHYGEAHISAVTLLGGPATGQDVITVVTFDRGGKYISYKQETDNR